jgi:hypothetical protein
MKQSHWASWTPGRNGWQRSRGLSRQWRRRSSAGARRLMCRPNVGIVRRGKRAVLIGN